MKSNQDFGSKLLIAFFKVEIGFRKEIFGVGPQRGTEQGKAAEFQLSLFFFFSLLSLSLSTKVGWTEIHLYQRKFETDFQNLLVFRSLHSWRQYNLAGSQLAFPVFLPVFDTLVTPKLLPVKPVNITFLAIAGIYLASCTNTTNKNTMKQDAGKEIATIDSLLRSPVYALEMATTLDAAYQSAAGQKPTDFLTPAEDIATVKKSVKEEKIATSLAGFYALESGIGALTATNSKKPTDILNSIVSNSLDSGSVLLLNRFANATWKAGQPFRSLDRIKRPVFRVANLLPQEEVKKDYDQITAAAKELLSAMQDVKDSSIDGQMKKLRSLLQSKEFAYRMSGWLDDYYYKSQNQTPPASGPVADTATIDKSAREQKIATNVAGFYAVECGVSYFVTTRGEQPSVILQSIVDNTISKEDKMLLARFANATWKAGQPFRGLDRITRDTFTPFYFLSETDIEKDFVQIRAAAKKLLESL